MRWRSRCDLRRNKGYASLQKTGDVTTTRLTRQAVDPYDPPFHPWKLHATILFITLLVPSSLNSFYTFSTSTRHTHTHTHTMVLNTVRYRSSANEFRQDTHLFDCPSSLISVGVLMPRLLQTLELTPCSMPRRRPPRLSRKLVNVRRLNSRPKRGYTCALCSC